MMDTGIYVFCLSAMQYASLPDSSDEFDRLFLHRYGDLCAVAKRVSLEEFCGPDADRRLADPEWVTPRAIDHGRVIAQVFRTSPVLPVPFGTLFSSPRILEDFIERNADMISGFFEYAANCEEWGVKALLDRERLKRSLTKANLEVVAAAVSPGLQYMRERRAEQMADQQARAWLEGNLRVVIDALDDRPIRSCQRRILGDSMHPDGREEVANLAALVARGRVADFRRRIEALNRDHAGDGLSFALSGPWPPYSFCPALDSPA